MNFTRVFGMPSLTCLLPVRRWHANVLYTRRLIPHFLAQISLISNVFKQYRDTTHIPCVYYETHSVLRSRLTLPFLCELVTSYLGHSVRVARVGQGCVLCTRIDPLRFLAACRRRRLNQGLVVALGFSRC